MHPIFSVHTTQEEFENEGFTLKMHQMFSVNTTSEDPSAKVVNCSSRLQYTRNAFLVLRSQNRPVVLIISHHEL